MSWAPEMGTIAFERETGPHHFRAGNGSPSLSCGKRDPTTFVRETGAIQQSTTTTTPAAWPDQGASGASMGPVQPHADGSAAQSSATLRVTVRQMSAVTGAASRVMVPGINTQSPSASRYSPM